MSKRMGVTHMVIPDAQVKPGVPVDHLAAAGEWAAEKRPDVIVCIGDFADMPSLSSYDKGKKSFEGRRYENDIASVHKAMSLLMTPINREIERRKRNKMKGWNPRLVMTLGNHEERILRAVNDDPKLEGLMSMDDLGYKEWGWEVYPYLEPVIIDGIAYCHFFSSGAMGRPVTSARALAMKKHMSCTMGHVQQTEIDMTQKRADGKQITGLFCGTFYQHDEDYLGTQGNQQRRHIVMKYRVDDGEYDPHFLSLDYLLHRYNNQE